MPEGSQRHLGDVTSVQVGGGSLIRGSPHLPILQDGHGIIADDSLQATWDTKRFESTTKLQTRRMPKHDRISQCGQSGSHLHQGNKTQPSVGIGLFFTKIWATAMLLKLSCSESISDVCDDV